MKPTTPYKQSEDTRWKTHEDTAEGACFALSCFWIIQTSKGEDYFKWLHDKDNVASVIDVTSDYSKAHNVADNDLKDEATTQQATKLLESRAFLRNVDFNYDGMQVKRAPAGKFKPVFQGIPLSLLEYTKAFNRPTYYLLSLSGVTSDGTHKAHAVAIKFCPVDCRLFDANVGEFATRDTLEFANWVESWSTVYANFFKSAAKCSCIAFVAKGAESKPSVAAIPTTTTTAPEKPASS